MLLRHVLEAGGAQEHGDGARRSADVPSIAEIAVRIERRYERVKRTAFSTPSPCSGQPDRTRRPGRHLRSRSSCRDQPERWPARAEDRSPQQSGHDLAAATNARSDSYRSIRVAERRALRSQMSKAPHALPLDALSGHAGATTGPRGERKRGGESGALTYRVRKAHREDLRACVRAMARQPEPQLRWRTRGRRPGASQHNLGSDAAHHARVWEPSGNSIERPASCAVSGDHIVPGEPTRVPNRVDDSRVAAASLRNTSHRSPRLRTSA